MIEDPEHLVDNARYLDSLYDAIAGRSRFAVRITGPGYVERHAWIVVIAVKPPTGRQRKPQVVWRWADEEQEYSCSVASFRQMTKEYV